MEKFVNTQLHPAHACNICTESFSANHQPVALPCQHIFGHECIKKWLLGGQGNTNACPSCRHVLIPRSNPRETFNALSIWQALSDQPSERLQIFMSKIWSGLQKLWQRHPRGSFTVTSILDQAIIPALTYTINYTTRNPGQDSMIDCYNLVAASWDSLGRPDLATGLAIPLVRLARLMTNTGAALPKYLTTSSRTNKLIWRANACLPMTDEHISWNFIIDAAQPASTLYFELLHLYTVLISQGIVHFPAPHPYPNRRHDIMNLVVERCCNKIGGNGCAWKGRPTNELKDTLVFVYGELRRYQLEKGKISLRGHSEEEAGVVRGIWALATWSSARVNRV